MISLASININKFAYFCAFCLFIEKPVGEKMILFGRHFGYGDVFVSVVSAVFLKFSGTTWP